MGQIGHVDAGGAVLDRFTWSNLASCHEPTSNSYDGVWNTYLLIAWGELVEPIS
jgi:hypothetical protein